MEFENHDEQEEEEEGGFPANYNKSSPTSHVGVVDAPPPPKPPQPRYRECLKNHAVGIGAHAVDGCGEFLPSGAAATMDALKCAACGCHRNFHRKETTHHHHHQPQHYFLTHSPAVHHQQNLYSPHSSRYYAAAAAAAQQRPLALPATSGGVEEEEEEDHHGLMSRKRHRTKFTGEQKEKMLAVAERLGWKIMKEEEAVVQRLCHDIGIKRNVFKVWMHNNKNTLGKKDNLNLTNPN